MSTMLALDARSLTPSCTANDLERSIKFYKSLGFTVTEEFKEEGKVQGAMLAAGKAVIALSQDDFSKGRDRVKGLGTRLHVETEQDIATLARQAKEAGVKLDAEPGPLPWGPMGFNVTDPDGYKLTISNPS